MQLNHIDISLHNDGSRPEHILPAVYTYTTINSAVSE